MTSPTKEMQGQECTICGGIEWCEVEGTREGGFKPQWKRCECLEKKIKEARVKNLQEKSGLVGSLIEKTFDNYYPQTKAQKIAQIKMREGGSFYVTGPWGSGKTHLLAASVNETITMGINSVLFSAPWLMKLIREDILNGEQNQILEKCCEIEFLAVDDLGKEKPTETVQQALFMLFDRREIQGLRTSVTSNYMPSTLATEKLDGAIVDRLLGMCKLIVIDGDSYRKKR